MIKRIKAKEIENWIDEEATSLISECKDNSDYWSEFDEKDCWDVAEKTYFVTYDDVMDIIRTIDISDEDREKLYSAFEVTKTK